MTNILILAAGRIQVNPNIERTYPVCLSELNGISLIEKIIDNLKEIKNCNYSFALGSDDISEFHLDDICKLLIPESQITVIPNHTMGSACSALLAACSLVQSQPLLIVSANELVTHKFNPILQDFYQRKLDAGTIVFRSVHPRYSYVKLDGKGLVTQVAQQSPISKFATAGVFWYDKTSDFINSAKSVIRKGATTNGQFYLAPVFNELILQQKKIGVVEIDKSCYIPLKTVKQIQQYEQGS